MPTAPRGTSGPGVTETEIHLGMTNDVAGAGETPYAAVSLAVEAYFQKVNQEEGGVCGRQIVLTVEDDEYLAELALARTQKLVTEDEVLAVIGALSTQAHRDVAAYLNDPNGDGDTADGVPDLFVSTGWSGWSDVATYPWTTAFLPDYLSDGRVLAAYIAANLPDQQIGLLYRNDEFGQDYLAAMEEAFGAGGNLFSQPYPVDDEDVSQEMGAVLDSGAEVIVLASTPDVTADAIVSARGGGFDSQFLLSYVNQPSNLASELGGGSEAEGCEGGPTDAGSVPAAHRAAHAHRGGDGQPNRDHEGQGGEVQGDLVAGDLPGAQVAHEQAGGREGPHLQDELRADRRAQAEHAQDRANPPGLGPQRPEMPAQGPPG